MFGPCRTIGRSSPATTYGKEQVMKKVWLSSLVSSEEAVKKVISQLQTYGLEAQGHFWEDDPEKMAWMKVREPLLDPKVALWAILASKEDLSTPSFRYGLSLLAITVQAERGIDFPVVVLQADGDKVSADTLTTPLKSVDVLSASAATLGAKLVAKVHTTSKEKAASEYRLDLYGNEKIGQWFEVGPRNNSWSGGMFAVSDGEITFHGVGPKGKLPDKAVLNYPLKGIKLNLGEKKYTAWAVQNELSPETSYFVRVKGAPEAILFGPYTSDEDAEVFVMTLK